MTFDDHGGQFEPARTLDGDWLVGDHPVVADGIDPDETTEVDRFTCGVCGNALDIVVGLGDDEPIELAPSTWQRAGFRSLGSVPGRPPLYVDARGLQAIRRRVTCGECNAEQVAIAAGGEWQPQRYVLVAHGTVPLPRKGRDWSSWIAAAVLVAVVLALAFANVAAVRDALGERRAAQGGRPVDARILAATESGGGPRMVASHHLRVTWRDPDPVERTIEIDQGTFIRYADADTAPLRVRGDDVTVEGDHEQRNDLVAMLVIDAAILLAIAGIAFFAWRNARPISRG